MEVGLIFFAGTLAGVILAAGIFALGVHLEARDVLNTIRDLVDEGHTYESAYRFLRRGEL
jgi:hypothetical protein